MYAHPSFTRGCPESLTKLRKSTSASRRRFSKASSSDESDGNSSDSSPVRSVSPSPTRNIPSNCFQHAVHSRIPPAVSTTQYMNPPWLTFCAPSYQRTMPAVSLPPTPRADGSGRLDLLALAIEREHCSV